ncbi:hypothetical protein, partial [Xanthovirga aplysinae]|uniref:hypothetical protein n=1 Tax=Xanthovirga aplysinae TaxID=2529853 RepID=UPI001CA38D51
QLLAILIGLVLCGGPIIFWYLLLHSSNKKDGKEFQKSPPSTIKFKRPHRSAESCFNQYFLKENNKQSD